MEWKTNLSLSLPNYHKITGKAIVLNFPNLISGLVAPISDVKAIKTA
jgi:hypothetical protein